MNKYTKFTIAPYEFYSYPKTILGHFISEEGKEKTEPVLYLGVTSWQEKKKSLEIANGMIKFLEESMLLS